MKFSYIISAFALASAFTACSGTIDPGNGEDPDMGDITGPFTLSVDKTTIEADAKDPATFSLKDANGIDVTATHVKYFSLINVNTGDVINRSNVFTAIKDGEYTFKAKYKTYESENTVTVKAQNRAKYEKYFRKVPVHEITDVMCVNCPSMVQALESVAPIWKSQMLVIGVHGGYSQVDPWMIGNMPADFLTSFGGLGYPFAVFNLDRAIKNNERNGKAIGAIIEEQLRKYPATCGLKLSSKLTAEGNIEVNASVASSTGGKYNIGYGVLMNGLVFVGGHSVNKDNIYNDVLVGSTGNYKKYSVKDEISIEAGKEHNAKPHVFEKGLHLCADINKDNMKNARVFAFALRLVDGKPIVDNIVDCPLGESIDYVLNK